MKDKNRSGLSVKWIVKDDKIVLSTATNFITPTAIEVIQSQFKGVKLIQGIRLTRKPSDDNPDIKFHRFPGRISLHLRLNQDINHRPELNIFINIDNNSFEIDRIPDSDHIIFTSNWYPLLSDEISEIKILLDELNISDLKKLTIRQFIDLVRAESDYLSIKGTAGHYDPTYKADSCASKLSCCTDIPLNITAKLYPYQSTGVSWLTSMAKENLGCILADEMGLGKTLQIIIIITKFKLIWAGVSLIIAPATLLENWKREFAKFTSGIDVHIHSGNERTGFPSKLKMYDVIITSYDLAVRDQGMLGMIEWDFIVLDEAQAIKNPRTRRARTTKLFTKKCAIAVTGTPLENRLMDLWSLMDYSCPGLLGTQKQFEDKYSDTVESAQLIEQIVSPLMLRRKVSDVAKDLPDKIIIPQAINMSDESNIGYEELRQTILEQYGKSATLVSLTKLRQYCTHPVLVNHDLEFNVTACEKYSRLLEILDEIIESKEKAIIFTSFTKMIDIMFFDLPLKLGVVCEKIDGRTPIENRQLIVDKFSGSEGSTILILNPKAAGVGLNITSANHVIHYTLEWNPSVEDQATARAYRRGQKLPVTVHRLFYANTVEEIIDDRIERKREMANLAVVGSTGAETDTVDIIRALNISPIN